MKIYVMRHGQTCWNAMGRTQGRTNNRLSSQGKTQVCEAAKNFRNCKFEIIFSSPLMRTVQTANIMNSYHNIKIIKDERLTEIEQGIFTGRYKNSLSEYEQQLKQSRDKICKMETYESVRNRVLDFLNYLKTTSYSSILIITHDIVAGCIENYFNDKINLNKNSYARNFKNAEIKQFYLNV